MSVKKIISFLKGKGIEPTADDLTNLTDLLDEPRKDMPPTNDNSNSYLVKALEEEKAKNKALEGEIKDIKKTNTKLESDIKVLIDENAEREKERTAQAKAYQDKLDADAKEKQAKDIKDRIDQLILENRIAPKDEKLIARLQTMDLETIDDIASGLPIMSGTNNTDRKPINNDTKATTEFDLLTSGISQSIKDSIAKTIN